MKKLVFLFLVLSHVSTAQQVDTVNIFTCLEAFQSNCPKAGEEPLIDQKTRLKINNLKAQWYPDLDFNVQASYQSDIPKIDVDIPIDAEFPIPSKDQYKATMDVSQLVYDGGVVSSAEDLESMKGKVERQSVAVELYAIKEQVMEVYFGILLMHKQARILQSALKELDTKIQAMRSAVANGTMLPTDLKKLQAERLDMESNIDNLHTQVQTSHAVLNELTGLETDSSTWLTLPEISMDEDIAYNRPENKMFSLQKEQLHFRQDLLRAERKPKIQAFGQIGYGKPGLNMLNDEFDTFYLVGARLSWDIWDWKQNNRKHQMAEVQKQIVDVKTDAFNEMLGVKLEQTEGDISKLEHTLERDKDIIALRQDIIKSSRSKLDHGVITSADYISDLNQLTKAKIKHERHKIELLKARLNQLYIIGKL